VAPGQGAGGKFKVGGEDVRGGDFVVEIIKPTGGGDGPGHAFGEDEARRVDQVLKRALGSNLNIFTFQDLFRSG
jgi:hypothetical protein